MLEKNYTEKFYFNNLDTLRFFAFLSVFCSHCVGVFGYKFHNKYLELIHRHFFVNGDLGVGFFFVLSGFLITWLLLIEKEKNGNINVLHFYMRRVLRIWAVYFLVVLIGFSIGMQSPVPYHSDISQLKWYLTFLANYDLVFNGQTNPLVNILWSVAIEEQYYVIWPLFFLFFKKKLLPFVCMIIIIISFIFRYNHTENMNYSTVEVMSNLAFGGLIAYYSFCNTKFINYISELKKSTIVCVYLLLFIAIPLKGFSHYFGETIFKMYYPFEAIIFSSIFSIIIMEQCFSKNSFFKLGNLKRLSSLGKISYGLYAYHMLMFPIAIYVTTLFNIENQSLYSYFVKTTISFILTLFFSYFSYKYFESKILYYKKYFLSN